MRLQKSKIKSILKKDVNEKSEQEKAIVKKEGEEKPIEKRDWVLTIIDSEMDVDSQNNILLKNGHKEYDFWDIYNNDKDKYSNLIFRVTDKNSEYFEIFSKQYDNHYKPVFTGGGYNFKSNTIPILN